MPPSLLPKQRFELLWLIAAITIHFSLFSIRLLPRHFLPVKLPTRSVTFSGDHENISVLLAEVTGIDLEHRKVQLEDDQLCYDYLIVAAGATHAYFGHPEWAIYAPGLKTLEDATEIRRRMLLAFEIAERRARLNHADEPHQFRCSWRRPDRS